MIFILEVIILKIIFCFLIIVKYFFIKFFGFKLFRKIVIFILVKLNLGKRILNNILICDIDF